MTSGITSGAFTIPENRVRPRKRGCLTRAQAAAVPISTEPQAVANAILRDRASPSSSSWSWPRAAYHLRVKPPQVLGSSEALKEYSTRAAIGR